MTPAQRALLRGLTRDELVIVLDELVGPWTDDSRVRLAVMMAIHARARRLGEAVIAAGSAEAAALDALVKRPMSTRRRRAYLNAQAAYQRVDRAARRAHDEHSRLCALPIPLPEPGGGA